MKFIPIGESHNKTSQIVRKPMKLTYTELLKGSNYGHKAIK